MFRGSSKWRSAFFKQQAITELLVAAKESVTNIHKRIEMCIVSTLLTKALLVVGLHELQVLRKASRISVTRVALAGQQQKMKKQ
jgi:hypothetical protein